jgi:hypothetical protein
MSSRAYILGFMDKLADAAKDRADMNSYFAAKDKANGVQEPVPYKTPETFGDAVKYMGGRAKAHLGSLGRGVLSAAGVTGLRAGQGLAELGLWIPSMADKLLFGTLMGIDEGRGMTGRMLGNFHRGIDRKVHALRKWSDDYDYRNRIGGRFNRFLNGAAADAVGGFMGWGGVGGLTRRSLLGLGFGALGGYNAVTGGREKELRDREAWLHGLHPRDRVSIDATSTATNQADAPTLDEYRRYHMPAYTEQTSPTGYINVPYHWRTTAMGGPTQFREFGT